MKHTTRSAALIALTAIAGAASAAPPNVIATSGGNPGADAVLIEAPKYRARRAGQRRLDRRRAPISIRMHVSRS
jgi:hypothetical protein